MGMVEWKRQHWDLHGEKDKEVRRKSQNEEEGETGKGRCPLITISIVGICIRILLLPKMQMQLIANPSKSLVGTLYSAHVWVFVSGFSLTRCYLSSSLVSSQQRGGDGGSTPYCSSLTPVCVMDGGRDGLMDERTDTLPQQKEKHFDC